MSQQNAPELPPSIVALATLAAGVAGGHPTQPRCQLNRLREMGIPESQIATVVELARHVREEAARRDDEDLDAALGAQPDAGKEASGGCCGSETEAEPESEASEGGCCGSEPEPAKTGGSCC